MKYGGKSDFLRFSKKAYENNFQGNHFHPNQLIAAAAENSCKEKFLSYLKKREYFVFAISY